MSEDQALLLWTHQLTTEEYAELERIAPNPVGNLADLDRELEFLVRGSDPMSGPSGQNTCYPICPGSPSNCSFCCPTKTLTGTALCCA